MRTSCTVTSCCTGAGAPSERFGCLRTWLHDIFEAGFNELPIRLAGIAQNLTISPKPLRYMVLLSKLTPEYSTFTSKNRDHS